MATCIEKLIEEFHQKAYGSKQYLENMQRIISDGRVPEKEAIEKFNVSLETLREKYLSIYQLASEQLSKEEMPGEDMPVEAYGKALANSRAVKYKKLLASAKGALESFIAVKSFIASYASALHPYQETASEFLERLNSRALEDPDQIVEGTAGPETFLKAISCQDFDSEENVEVLDQVSGYFSKKVLMGIATRKYFMEADSAKALPDAEEEKTEDRTEEDEDIIESDFVRKLRMYSAFLDDGEDIGHFTRGIQPAEEKKITASTFMNDMHKGAEEAEKVILKEVCSRNYVSGNLLAVTKALPCAQANAVMNYLYRKGYLRKYALTPGGEFFCASPRLMKAMTFNECSKFVGIRQRSAEEWGESIEDKAASAAARIAYVNLYQIIFMHLMRRNVTSYNTAMSFCTDAFFVGIRAAETPDEGEFALGAFWDAPEECDHFMDIVKDNLSTCRKAARVFVAGIRQEKAKAVAQAVLGELESELSEAAIYLYSLADNSFYEYPSMVPLDIKEMYGETARESFVETCGETVEESSAGAGKNTAEEAQPIETAEETEGALVAQEKNHADEEKAVSVVPAMEIQLAATDMETVYSFLAEQRFYAAAAYAKSCSLTDRSKELSYNQLAYALNDPMGRCIYSTENVFQLISERGIFEEMLTISTAARLFFSSQIRYDYNIKPFYDGIKNYEVLNQFPVLSLVLYSLMDFKHTYKRGIDTYVGYRMKSRAELDRDIARLKNEARSFYDNFVVGRKKEKASQKRFIETKQLIFSVNSDIGVYIRSIIDGDKDMLPLMADFLQENFFGEEDEISETTIDGDKLWKYIVAYWEKAGENMICRRHENLMSHLRSNITNTTVKAVQLMARWHVLAEQENNRVEDETTTAFERLRKPLMENLSAAMEELKRGMSASASDVEKVSGLQVIFKTIQEIQSCMEGTMDEHAWKYFYAEFLLTDDIMLDENFLPDLDMHSSELKILQPTNRIRSHVRKLSKGEMTYRKRLDEILNEQGDDYGAARLIAEYLSYGENQMQEPGNQEEESLLLAMIESGEIYAKDTADLRKADFIGELELAQSYGQIDNSAEDKKEKILQIVDGWYKWAVDSGNYGFLNKVMNGYLEEIRETAKSREADLREQLETFKETSVSGLSGEVKEKRILRIEAMIREQNYTVAEDLLARAARTEEAREDVIEEDFLKEFLDNYDDYYQPVATHKANFASLVSSRTRNKEERGAKKLADNWLPGGSNLGRERLTVLLTCFGFRVRIVKAQNVIGKFENYIIQTDTARGGEKNNYTHPIAVFGSCALQDGFRVVCINGGYDADGLIDVMKQIGNAKHTMILLDYALSKGERRRLARKTKRDLGDKLFCVVDRTVMMFLIRNYDETRINRMLISLIVPFGYYQPYVWESVNVMPPEIFMGRKYELERIKSATGANIVYGGRQLGKSALLKKAKDDINLDEYGSRAVYVEIKGLNYGDAARKIGHELYDQDILEYDLETTDWDELARAIKRRLQSQNRRIPYLLLLLDEADAFIESCEAVNYKPFDSLKDVQGIGTGRFKFVIAGLHNIIRFKREAALSNDSVLTHLEAMTVRPFNISEARELMEIPLHYLGLRFPKEKESLVTLILATTNYFPGLIQMYCAKLLDAMRKKDYAGYDEVDSPIYEVSEEHIKKVLADPEFMQQIWEKYIITLKLDEDNYYYLIALLMAHLYQTNGYSRGYAPEDIKEAGTELGISRIAALDITKLTALMEELRELNVLRSTDENHYLFTRFTFFQMMGTNTEVADKLLEYMEG